MSDERIANELMSLENEQEAVHEKCLEYQRKLMKPLWEKRRDIVKNIPNFWAEVITNSPFFEGPGDENDVEALENLKDFHVEYDENRPNYRKVVAHFGKNGVFKNEVLTKEFTIDKDEGTVISKANVEYHSGKEPNNKKRKGDDIDADLDFNFLQWFSDDSIPLGALLTEEVFPGALDFYRGGEDSDDLDEDIELGSDSEEDEDEPKPKKAKK
ncbi:hypothetical protein BC940DRAFT_313413 [Gongronella butleri]|nr:hypothetical protein BC940DRAFT_313413 [Gongronella butleri]